MENGQSAQAGTEASTGAGELASFLWETGVTLFEDIEEYLASERGAQVRRALAIGLITGAPLIVKLPVVKNTPLGRLLVFAGGAALIVKLGEALRDWEPERRLSGETAGPAPA
jgi:hypothetical protein